MGEKLCLTTLDVSLVGVEKGGHKNIRVIEKNNGKTRRANLSENHHKLLLRRFKTNRIPCVDLSPRITASHCGSENFLLGLNL